MGNQSPQLIVGAQMERNALHWLLTPDAYMTSVYVWWRLMTPIRVLYIPRNHEAIELTGQLIDTIEPRMIYDKLSILLYYVGDLWM